jgi:hypothetical protein
MMDSTYNNLMLAGQQTMAGAPVGAPSLKVRLDYAVKEAEDRLVEAKRAREIFQKYPELEELLNIMQKGRF